MCILITWESIYIADWFSRSGESLSEFLLSSQGNTDDSGPQTTLSSQALENINQNSKELLKLKLSKLLNELANYSANSFFCSVQHFS